MVTYGNLSHIPLGVLKETTSDAGELPTFVWATMRK